MKVSIVIPVHNGEKYLNKIYKSIKEQTYKDIEVIFLNDMSSDNSLEILKAIAKKDKKVLVHSSRRQCGPGGAKTEGLKYAKGVYVTFIDCDDYIASDYIEDMVKCAKDNNLPSIILTNFTKVDEEGNITYVRDYQNAKRAFYQKFTTWGKLYKRSYLEKYELYPPYGLVLEDVLFHGGIVISNPTYAYTPNAGYYYVYHSTSISHTTLKKFRDKELAESTQYLIALKNNKNLTIEGKERLPYYAFRYVCWHLLKSGNNVGWSAMKKEWEMAFNFLDQEFPMYRKFKSMNLKNERFIIKVVLWNILLLHKIHLDKIFFRIYSNINLEKLWPNM